MSALPITSQLLGQFKPSKRFSSKHGTRITSIDFDDSGEWCVTAGDDETIQLYDCKRGKSIPVDSVDIDIPRLCIPKKCRLCVDKGRWYTTEDVNLDTLRYLSLHDNHYVRYFKGHTNKVISLEISPTDEQFLTAGLDDTVRLWNLNSPNCQGCLNVPSPSLAAFDPTGIIFAVVSHPLSTLMLYDLRNFDKEPFSVFPLNDDKYLQKISYPPRMPEFSKLEFSNDGKSILVGTTGEVHYILDAFAGAIKARLIDHVASDHSGLSSGDVCLTPDGRYVLGGSGDKKIAIWDTQQPVREKSITPIHKLDAKSFGVPNVVAINPRSALLATASTELVSLPQFF